MRTTTSLAASLLVLGLGCSPEPRAGDDEEGDGGAGEDTGADVDTGEETDSETAANDIDDCGGSPVVGAWEGTYEGVGESAEIGMGQLPLSGTVSFEITCEEKLVLTGTMEGEESDWLPFMATLTGEYDEEANELTADLEGQAMGVDGFGAMSGSVTGDEPLTMSGVWHAEAPSIEGAGSGTWTASME